MKEDINALNASDEESVNNAQEESVNNTQEDDDEFAETNKLLALSSDLLNDEGPTLVDEGDIIDDDTYRKFVYDFYDDKYKCRQCFTSDKIEKKTDLNGNIFINCYYCNYQLQILTFQMLKRLIQALSEEKHNLKIFLHQLM